MEPQQFSDEDIKSILEKASKDAAENQKKADQERQFDRPVPQNNFERPKAREDLSEKGEHSLSEMNRLTKMGKGEKTFDLWGNLVTIRTLTQKEELDLLSKVSSYPVTSRDRAFAIFCVATCTESFNGEPVFKRLPLTKDQDMYQFKFDYFVENVSPMVINQIINERIELNQEIYEKAEYAKKKSETEESGTT